MHHWQRAELRELMAERGVSACDRRSAAGDLFAGMSAERHADPGDLGRTARPSSSSWNVAATSAPSSAVHSAECLRRLRPLSQDRPLAALTEIECDEVAWPHDLVQADASNARDFAVDAGVMVAEEANPGSNARDQLVEPGGFAHPAISLSVALESHTRWRVVDEEDVDVSQLEECLDLVPGVVALRVALEML